jgi:hypothetical protein
MYHGAHIWADLWSEELGGRESIPIVPDLLLLSLWELRGGVSGLLRAGAVTDKLFTQVEEYGGRADLRGVGTWAALEEGSRRGQAGKRPVSCQRAS